MQHPERPLDLATGIPDIGRVSIKASAGTGKTYSLTVLAVQHVVEHDIRPDQLLMVTYTREATSELRAKTRERAQETLDALRSEKSFDESSWMHRMAEPSRRDLSINRLNNFLARFDEVSVSTIHGFCQNVLRRGGLRSPVSTNFSVVPNIDHIIDQVVTDHLLEKLAHSPSFLTHLSQESIEDSPEKPSSVNKDAVTSTIKKIRDAVKRVISNQGCLVLPQVQGPLVSVLPDDLDAERPTHDLALLISHEVQTLVALVHERCAHDNIITYDDLVRLVRIALHPQPSDFATPHEFESHAHEAQQLAASIAEQYKVIMVDEFQDTDAAQWDIFRTIHQAGNGTLITVGDPKQAIYRFRGADVNVYLDAVSDAEFRYVLNTNRRSDKPLLDAVETLLSGQTFDISQSVEFEHVDHDPEKRTGYFATPLEIRYLGSEQKTKAGKPTGNSAEFVMSNFMADMANEIVALLTSNIALPDKSSPIKGTTRTLRPKDIAVLVHAHNDAQAVVEALKRVNVPAIRLKTESVFGTPASMHWLMLLAALANPAKPAAVRSFGLSWFGGLHIDDLLDDSDDTLTKLQRQCAQLALDLRQKGMTGLYLQFRNNAQFLQRVLSMPDGERVITDLDHIAEILASHPRISTRAGASECHEILVELIDDPDSESEEQKRRIETDEDSVIVMTMHTSKGLQFPVVFLPTAHKSPYLLNTNPLMFPFDFGDGVRRVVDVASSFDNAKDWQFIPTDDRDSPIRRLEAPKGSDQTHSRKAITDADAREDRRRLLYVALTRAEHKLVTYFSPYDARNLTEPWAQTLAEVADLPILPKATDDLTHAMNTIVHRSKNNDALTTIDAISLPQIPVDPLVWSGSTTGRNSIQTTPTTAEFKRDPATVTINGFQRWSYSGLARLVAGEKSPHSPHSDVIAQVNELPAELESRSGKNAADESNDPVVGQRVVSRLDGITDSDQLMPMASIAGSAALGNLVHDLLDTLDPSEPDLASRVRHEVERRLALWQSTIDPSKLTDGLVLAMNTPVAPITSDTVVSLGVTHRLSEMSFDFCLPQDVNFPLADIGEALLLDAEIPDAFMSYAKDLASDAFQNVRIAGYMTGSIDAVFRVDVKGERQYLVSDYKTNKLHSYEEAEPLLAYHPANLPAAMVKDGYVLQALIYTVALQRFLRSRIADYDYNRHVAGVSYLFLRGMIGHVTTDQQQFGVYFWKPGLATIDALDQLFAIGKN